MSYAKLGGVQLVTAIVETVAKTTSAATDAITGRHAKEARSASNVEKGARAELEGAQASAQSLQQAALIAAEGQVATTAARIEAEKKVTEKRNRVILIGSGALAGALVLGLVGYRLTRNP
jgi:hypothetical protein